MDDRKLLSLSIDDSKKEDLFTSLLGLKTPAGKSKEERIKETKDIENRFQCWNRVDLALSYKGLDRKPIIELIRDKYPDTLPCSIYELKDYCLYSGHRMTIIKEGKPLHLDCICFNEVFEDKYCFSLNELYFDKEFIMEISNLTGVPKAFFVSQVDFTKGRYNIRLLYNLLELVDPDYQLTEEMPEETLNKLEELFLSFYLLLGLKDPFMFQMNNPFESHGRDNVNFDGLMEDFFRDNGY